MSDSSHSSPANDIDASITAPEVRGQLDRIFSSAPFQRSRRLQDFLRYITDLTLHERQEDINEFLIGVEVFGRGPDYNPSEDSIVRRQAHALRQKLDEYYASEGANDPIVVEVPLGRYIPAFRQRKTPPVTLQEPSASAMAKASGRAAQPRWGAWLWVTAVAVALAFAVGRVSVYSPASARSGELRPSADVLELWGPWLAADRGPLIVFSSPLTGVVKRFELPLVPDNVPSPLELTGEMERRFRQRLEIPGGGNLYIWPTVTSAKTGEALGAVPLSALFAAKGMRPRATLSRLLTWEAFRHENIIALGHSEQNHVVGPLLEKYALHLTETDGERDRRIVNAAPAGDEPPYYEIQYAEEDDGATLEYVLISMLPGLDDGRELLLVSGLNTQATLVGIEFLTDPELARALLDGLYERAPDHRGPWRFQAVLSAEVRDKEPTGSEIELIRVLGDQ